MRRDDARSEALADQVEQAIFSFGDTSQRSQQSSSHVLGISDIGGCREYVRRMILDEPFTDHPTRYMLASFVGHAVGDLTERVLTGTFENAYSQGQVSVQLPNGVTLSGHPDLVAPNEVIDIKTKDGLAVARQGASTQHRWQVSLYAAALIDSGEIGPNPTCALVYIDRSGVETRPYVEAWTYDPSDLDEIVQWIDDVIYAVEHHEEASRDKPREFCWAACPYVSACRGADTDAEGLIQDEDALLAVKAYLDAQAREKAASRDRESAAAALKGVAGSTGDHVVRWITVPAGEVAAFSRREYERLDLRPVPKVER